MPTLVPLTSEMNWVSRLSDLAAWEPKSTPTLVLSPHPDDETLGAGGLIARLRIRGVAVTVAAITDGENAYADTDNLREVRIPEQVEALRRLGVSSSMVHRFSLPDREVSAHENELVDRLLPLVHSGMHIVAPWQGDFHPDHEATGRAAARVAEQTGASVTYYLFWTWHRAEPGILEGLNAVQLSLSDEELKAKLYALEAHASQLNHSDGQPILSPELLAPARRTFEVYLR